MEQKSSVEIYLHLGCLENSRRKGYEERHKYRPIVPKQEFGAFVRSASDTHHIAAALLG